MVCVSAGQGGPGTTGGVVTHGWGRQVEVIVGLSPSSAGRRGSSSLPAVYRSLVTVMSVW